MAGEIRNFSNDYDWLIKEYALSPLIVTGTEIGEEILSYSAVNQLVERCAAYLKAQKIQPGDVITAFLPSSAEAIICFLTSCRYGYTYAPFSCTATKREVLQWLELVKPKLCLTSELISSEVQDAIKESKVSLAYIKTDQKFDWLTEDEVKADKIYDSKIYLATSGTTGEPKAMVLDVNRLWSSGKAFAEFHNLPKNTVRFWNYLPMSYLGGLFNLALIPMSVGGSFVVDEPFSGKTILSFWQTVDRFDINALWFAPSIAAGLLAMAERTNQNLSDKYKDKIKIAFIGMAPVKLSLKQRFKETFGFNLLENFALSETTFFTSETDSEQRTECSVGQILPYVKIKLIESANTEDSISGELPQEICVKTPYLFDGYLSANGKVTLELDSEGYFATKDLGKLNNQTLVITGRTRDIIKKGGFFVALREIELLAEKHPLVKEAAAVRITHDFYGETFNLFLILKEQSDSSAKDLVSSFLHENLVKYKWPNQILVRDTFPRTSSGKIQKHKLIEGSI